MIIQRTNPQTVQQNPFFGKGRITLRMTDSNVSLFIKNELRQARVPVSEPDFPHHYFEFGHDKIDKTKSLEEQQLQARNIIAADKIIVDCVDDYLEKNCSEETYLNSEVIPDVTRLRWKYFESDKPIPSSRLAIAIKTKLGTYA